MPPPIEGTVVQFELFNGVDEVLLGPEQRGPRSVESGSELDLLSPVLFYPDVRLGDPLIYQLPDPDRLDPSVADLRRE